MDLNLFYQFFTSTISLSLTQSLVIFALSLPVPVDAILCSLSQCGLVGRVGQFFFLFQAVESLDFLGNFMHFWPWNHISMYRKPLGELFRDDPSACSPSSEF